LKKVNRSKLCVVDCAWNVFRMLLFMSIKVTIVEFSASFIFFCEVTQLYGVPAAFVEGDALHYYYYYYKFIIQGK